MLSPGVLLPTNGAGAALREAARELGVDAATCGAAAAAAAEADGENGAGGGPGGALPPPRATRSHLGLAAAAGGYRRLVACPSRVRHLFVAHRTADDDIPMGELFGEDEDEGEGGGEAGGAENGRKKKKNKHEAFSSSSSSSSSSASAAVELWTPGQPLPPDKRHVSLLLRFRLPRSSYATMAVRELTKRPGWDAGSSAAAAASAAAARGGATAVATVKEADETKEEEAREEEAAAIAAPPAAAAAAAAADPRPTAE
jgi:hypothetical protein